MSERWIRVCRVEDLREGTAKSVKILGRPYAVFNIAGELHGLDAACRHMRANLGAGTIKGAYVECFMHSWVYEIATGRCLTEAGMDAPVRSVKTENGEVWISVEWPE